MHTIPSKVQLPPPFSDNRGTIQNLLEQSCGGVSIIHTKAGEYRSNHFHKTDGHWLYVLSGKMHYAEDKVEEGSRGYMRPDYPPFIEIAEGEMVWTGPLIWHRSFFPVDTVLISMSLRPRDHASHEEDVVRAP